MPKATPPTDPFAGSEVNTITPANGADINKAHADQVALGLALIAEAKQAVAAVAAKIPKTQGHKGLAGLLSAFASVRHDLERAEQYQQELAAFLPPTGSLIPPGVPPEAPAEPAPEE